jgi:hypothetical protein
MAKTSSKMPKTIKLGIYLALTAGLAIQIFHAGEQEIVPTPFFFHWLRDSLLAAPIGIIATALTIEPARRLAPRLGIRGRGVAVLWSFLAAAVYSLGVIPGNLIHAGLFVQWHTHTSSLSHGFSDAIRVLDPAFVALVVAVFIVGAPWEITRPQTRATLSEA